SGSCLACRPLCFETRLEGPQASPLSRRRGQASPAPDTRLAAHECAATTEAHSEWKRTRCRNVRPHTLRMPRAPPRLPPEAGRPLAGLHSGGFALESEREPFPLPPEGWPDASTPR